MTRQPPAGIRPCRYTLSAVPPARAAEFLARHPDAVPAETLVAAFVANGHLFSASLLVTQADDLGRRLPGRALLCTDFIPV